MARNGKSKDKERHKSKRKNKEENPDSNQTEDKELTEHKEESLESQEQDCGSEHIGSEKKKLKKEMQLNEPTIDNEVNDNKDLNYEESKDENINKDINKDIDGLEKQKSKKSKKKKSKEKKNINKENDSNDKGIKVFNFGDDLSANVSAISGRKGLSLKRKINESTEAIIDMTEKEWISFKQLIPQIDDLFNNND